MIPMGKNFLFNPDKLLYYLNLINSSLTISLA